MALPNSEPDDSTTLALQIEGTNAQRVIVHRAGWRVVFYTDIDPPTGVWRDMDDAVAYIVTARRAA